MRTFWFVRLDALENSVAFSFSACWWDVEVSSTKILEGHLCELIGWPEWRCLSTSRSLLDLFGDALCTFAPFVILTGKYWFQRIEIILFVLRGISNCVELANKSMAVPTLRTWWSLTQRWNGASSFDVYLSPWFLEFLLYPFSWAHRWLSLESSKFESILVIFEYFLLLSVLACKFLFWLFQMYDLHALETRFYRNVAIFVDGDCVESFPTFTLLKSWFVFEKMTALYKCFVANFKACCGLSHIRLARWLRQFFVTFGILISTWPHKLSSVHPPQIILAKSLILWQTRFTIFRCRLEPNHAAIESPLKAYHKYEYLDLHHYHRNPVLLALGFGTLAQLLSFS